MGKETSNRGTEDFVPHRRFVTVAKAEEWWIKNARVNPAVFIHYCLKLAPAEHHKRWLNMFFHPDYSLVNIIGPRFSAKTTIAVMSIGWVIGHYPDKFNMIVSVSEEQSIGRIAELRFLIGENPAYRNVFPNVEIDTRRPGTKSEFSVVDTSMPYSVWGSRKGGSRIHPTIKGRGAGGGGIIGSRVTGVMLLDDIVDGRELTIAAQDKKENFIINTLMPCYHPDSGARIWNIGTRWMNGDIYGRFIDNPAWESLVIPALYEDDQGVVRSYWPGYWPVEALEEKRLQMNNDILFGTMFLCQPAETSLGLFTLDLFNKCVIDLTKAPEKLVLKSLFITTDFAVSTRTRADWNVIYACGITENDEVVVLDGLRYKIAPNLNLDTVIDFAVRMNAAYGERIGLTGILVEKVAFQVIFAHFLAEKNAYLPVVPVTPMGDKEHRARPIRDYMLLDRFWISDKIPFLSDMKAEFVSMGFARHDDTIDPFSLLLQHTAANQVTAKLNMVKDPFRI